MRFELLEPRQLLAGETGLVSLDSEQRSDARQHALAAPITWFETFSAVERVPVTSLASVDRRLPDGVAGPIPMAVGEWIVQLTGSAIKNVVSAADLSTLVQSHSDHATLSLIKGLGSEGLILVRVQGASRVDIEAVLESIDDFAHYGLNQLIQGQEITPNDTDFVRGAMPSLNGIGMPRAWQESIGSLNTVVGVLDTGIDLAHPDLYLNIWLNQGEIPQRFYSEDGELLLTDIDGDGLITFYDLNHATRSSTAPFELTIAGYQNGPNRDFVKDINGNGYIDAYDILADPLWADGRDTDGNGEVDDFFGLNLRGEGFAPNNPTDTQGHGTHVAGTIGAIGGNSAGVTGIAWQVSLMPLRILDSSNQGDTGSALRAVNYARSMRERYEVNANGRVVQGANVRVLNNSWGQPGGFEQTLQTAITASGEAGILFVAASGNGNFLGQGVDNDHTPFYPAGYSSPNIISVAAGTPDGQLAPFSNFGKQTVDIAAPGVGIRSTELGGGYGTRNGTSMATPHISGAAALIQSAFPFASVDEVKAAILSSVDEDINGFDRLSTGGRLNVGSAMAADVFAPFVRLLSKHDIETAGGTGTEFTVVFTHPGGIDPTTVGDGDFIVEHQWGARTSVLARLKQSRILVDGEGIEATYIADAPGGTWDPQDFGQYIISSVANGVRSIGGRGIRSEAIGSFSVRIEDPSFIYVESFEDAVGTKSLRDALIQANAAAPDHRTIILGAGLHPLSIPPVVDPASTFPLPDSLEGALTDNDAARWSGELTGDFDVIGNVTILGDRSDQTVIDAGGIDRVFKVHPGATLRLNRVTIQGGVAPAGQGGGGILSQGTLVLSQTTVRGNRTQASPASSPIGGGGIAAWNGTLTIEGTWIDENQSGIGAGVFIRGNTSGSMNTSTISNQVGGGLYSLATSSFVVNNSTFSNNMGGSGAIFSKVQGVIRPVPAPPPLKTRSDDGRFQVIAGVLNSLIPEDTNGFSDVYVYDSLLNVFEIASVTNTGALANGPSDPNNVGYISSDGRYVVFESRASNLVPNDRNESQDIFIRDRLLGTTTRVSVNSDGEEADADAIMHAISNDASRILFTSRATNLGPGSFSGRMNLYLHDVLAGTTSQITQNDGSDSSDYLFKISGDGSTVAYSSQRSSIVPDDTNNSSDVFVFDVESGLTERVSVATDGTQASGNSYTSAISDSGRFVYFSSDAIELDPASPIVGAGEFVRDRQLNQTFLRSAPADAASIFASQVTIFDDRVINDPIVSGRVTLDNALLAVRNPRPLADEVTTTNVIGPERFGVLQVSPLVAIDNEPPVHELLIDNPAINSGTRFQNDQRGQSRGEQPDVGAVEAISGSIEGRLFVDLNGNQRRDLNEPGVANVMVSASTLARPLVGQTRTTADDPTTPDVDEQGMFRFSSLRNDIYQFVFDLPDGFRLSQSPLEEIRQSPEPIALSRDATAVAFSSSATNLVAGDNNGHQDIFFLDRRSNNVQRISRGLMGAEPNDQSSQPSISADGRFVAYTSKASNLAVSDDEGFDDVFLFDRANAETTRISVGLRDLVNRNDIGGNGDSHSPMISPDGTYITFVSSAQNLSFDDTNGDIEDVFIYNIARDEISLVSDFLLGGQGVAARSFEPVVSAGGRVVAFTTDASDYQHRQASQSFDDRNAFSDVVLLRRSLGGPTDPISEFRLVSQGVGGVAGNGHSHSPSIDTTGNTIAFVSDASNLVTDDSNGVSDIFVLRQTSASQTELIRLVPDLALGIEADGPSHSPSISGDGRFVTFVSRATNWVSGQSNDQESVYVYSLEDGRVRRLSETADGRVANGSSVFPVISPDGRFVTFSTSATNLFLPSTPQIGGSVVVPNPLIESSVSFEIRAGQQLENLSFGLIPDSGIISGKVFVDELVPNLRYDLGEEVFAGVELFLDLNRNNRLDPGEPRVIADENGDYQFENVPALRELSVVVGLPQGFEQVAPENRIVPGFTFTLPAGGILNNLDVGFRPITTTGQSSDSTIRGRVMIDSNGNGIIDNDDSPAPGRIVYLDGGTPGVRDFNDPQAVTDADGYYEFTGLPATISPIRVLLDETFEQTAPVGSSFSLEKFPLQDVEKRGGNPQAVITADFNGNGFSDVAVVLSDTNTLSIRLNDGRGGFTSRKIDLNLSDLAGGGNRFLQPTAIVAGNFDSDDRIDVALTGNFSKSVLILRNFDEASGTFANTQVVDVGPEPLDLVAGNFSGNDSVDLVVLIKGENRLQVLTNDGAGTFTAGAGIATGGVSPSSIVTADFDRDTVPDIAVTHTRTSDSDATAGRLTLLYGDGNGGLILSPVSHTVQATPTDAAVGDFNGDGYPDLAVVNFASNSISILLGQADGSMLLHPTTLGTTQGAIDIAVADIDNDGDDDILVTKLQQREVAIFRNISARGIENEVRFEPQESIGLGRFAFAERAPFALANLDNDQSAPNGSGTIDIIAVPQNTDTLFVLQNTLVQGARRAAVSGARSDIVSNVDFLIRPAILLPSFAFESTPLPIVENSAEQTVMIVNITKGRPEGPALRFSATSSNPGLIANPMVELSEDGTRASLKYRPTLGASGTTEITVRAVDAGANGIFGDLDDGVFERSFTAVVLKAAQPGGSSVVFTGEGEVFDMASRPNDTLSNITLVDIRGEGSNSIVIDRSKISQFTPDRRLTVIADNDDVVTFDAGWSVQTPEFIDGLFTHIITAPTLNIPPGAPQDADHSNLVRVELRNDRPHQNPLLFADVDRNTSVEPLDALRILIEIRNRGAGPITPPTSSSDISPMYFDVTGDNLLAPIDALQVLNHIARSRRNDGEGEAGVREALPRQMHFDGAQVVNDREQVERPIDRGVDNSDARQMLQSINFQTQITPQVWPDTIDGETIGSETTSDLDNRISLIDEVMADPRLLIL